MSWRKQLLIIATVGVIAVAVAPIEASANGRVNAVERLEVMPQRPLSPADFCGGRFPAYGFDACGYREVRYGDGSCWRRLPHRAIGPAPPRRVWVCG